MVRESPIGIENFDEVIQKNCFYVDKTDFIKSWWEAKSKSTLITRPRRFGKTLTMSMLNCFFSVNYANRGDLFQGLNIWQYEEYRKLQGTYPVIFLSFADIQDGKIEFAIQGIKEKILGQYSLYAYIQDSPQLSNIEKKQFQLVQPEMNDRTAVSAINLLCSCLYKYYKKNPIILLDEYDTPMITAYNKGYWEELADFMRSFFNATFKTNLYLEKGLMTGITRVAKESIFSGLNNLKVVSTISPEYADVFGFTEKEVFAAMDERGKTEEDKEEVKRYYDGFTFGGEKEIYNPWSIIHYLDEGELKPYWANTSSNEMITKIIREGSEELRLDIISLLNGEKIKSELDEYLIFDELDDDKTVWTLLVSAGYLRIDSKEGEQYTLSITNYETKQVFKDAIRRLIKNGQKVYDKFAKALLSGNRIEITTAVKKFADAAFSFYDANHREPECFYHGFCLGLAAELHEDYIIKSNRESGIGRADVWLYPRNRKGDAIVLEFKSIEEKTDEKSLADAAKFAVNQIEEKKYITDLKDEGFDESHIRKYGFAFSGKEVFVEEG